MKSAKLKALNAFFIFAFVMAGISPACAFISGKSGYLQVCASDGSLKTIKVSEGSDLYALYELTNKDQSNQTDQNPEHAKKQDCGFCFANSNITKTLLSSGSVQVFNHGSFIPAGSGTIVFKSAFSSYYQPRGPPLFI